MKKLEVFDPPMCCSSGVCGPNVDPVLAAFNGTLEWLRSHGVEVVRYNPTQQYEAFVRNPKVVDAINRRGIDVLPLILVDGEIVSMGGYPDREELAAMVGLNDESMTEETQV